MTKQRADAEQYVINTLGTHPSSFNIDAIVDKIYEVLGHYDFTKTESTPDWYWEVIKAHSEPTPLDIIREKRITYLSALAKAESLKRESDEYIRAGIKDGISMYAIAKELHMSESAIAYIRDQGK